MKKVFLFLFASSMALMAGAEIRVLDDVKLGEGFFPRFADAETVTYLSSENAYYIGRSNDAAGLRVDNEDLTLNLYRDGQKTVLQPHGDVNYVWASLSPNHKYILFNTKFGTAICDLNGKEIINLGNINAPVWYGNDYVVGMNDLHDGYHFTSSEIVIASVDGTERKTLTTTKDMSYYPDVDAKTGRIVYHTELGDIRMLQLNLTEEPIRKQAPRLVKEIDASILDKMQRQAKKAASKDPKDYKIYINPGHGGYGGDDRGMYLYPIFVNGSVNKNCSIYKEKYKELTEKGVAKADSLAADYTRQQTFWESQSNLDKGLRLDTMLRELGFKTKLSRITNTEADDRSLSGIVAEANAYGADFMLSIHSNAGNPSNYILQIHSGITPGDTYGLNGYSDKVPQAVCDEARAITSLMGQYQYMNEVSCWSREPMIVGDKTFARTVMGWSNGYGVLRNLRVPGTISEGMMHDYTPETYRLVNIDYKRQESFYFAKTFIEHFCDGKLPYGAIGGKLNDAYRKQIFPDYKPRKNTRDVFMPINGGVVELWQNDTKLATYTTDTLYNGCYFFWNLQPGTYTVKAKPDGYYPQEKTLVVENNKITYGIFDLSLARQTPLEVESYSPAVELTDSQMVSSPITFDFNWDVKDEETAAALTVVGEKDGVTTTVEGTCTFENGNRRMVFKPNSKRFDPATEYTVTLSTEACHPDETYENHLQAPVTFKFRTVLRGSMQLLQSYPSEGAVNVPLKPSFITIYDAKFNTRSKNQMAVMDAAGNVMTPATRNVTINKAPAPYGYASFELAEELQPNTDYKLVLYPELKDVNNVMLNETIYIAFRTGDATTPSVELVNNLDELCFSADKENSTGVASISTLRFTNKKAEGLASNKLAYTFTEDDGEALYATTLTSIQCNSNSTFGMHVFSDYSFNALYAKWIVEGDIKYTKICDLDYAGWLYQEADMSALPVGVDYQFMGLKLVHQPSLLSTSGEFCVDALRVHFEPNPENKPTDVENIVSTTDNIKVIENGYLQILLNGVKYNAEGKVIQ